MAHESKDWLAADKKGLAQLITKRGKTFVIGELIQNAWDAPGVTEVNVWMEVIPGKPQARISIEDDAPAGWEDISESYTLFAPSKKKQDPTKRGRFNLGEKLVLAICAEAKIISVNAGMVFDKDGRRPTKLRRVKGTDFTGLIPMTREEAKEVEAYVKTLLPPLGIKTTFNGDNLIERHPHHTVGYSLPTEIEDEDGNLRPTTRLTTVDIYDPAEGETGTLYEMGIPVVETGDRWHVNVHQKVPLNMDRDNVRPAYLRAIRTLVLNTAFERLEKESFASPWVAQAVTDKNISPHALDSYLSAKYGDNRVIADPNNPESVSRAQAAGYTVIAGRSEAKETWAKIKETGLALPAGQVFPKNLVPVVNEIPEKKWTPGIANIVAYAKALALRLLDVHIMVTIKNDSQASISASYGGRHLMFNVGRLGYAWFDKGPSVEVNDLIIHEFGHHFEENHLSTNYYHALTKLGAQLTELALRDPKFFKSFGWE